MINKIYIDLDGVMANFEKALVEQCGIHYWDRKVDKYWHVVDKVPNFYYNLDVLPNAFSMFKTILTAHGHNVVEVLTANPRPTNCLVSAADDKRRWVHDLIDNDVIVNCVDGGKNKYKFLDENPNSLLIDDYDRNIKSWIEHGGCGILHTDPDSTIAKLKLLGLL